MQLEENIFSFFGPHCDHGLNTLTLHLTEPVVDELEHFRTISVLNASPHEHFNCIVKQYHGRASKLLQTITKHTVPVLDSNLKRNKLI